MDASAPAWHLRQVKASAGSGKTYELTRCFLQRVAACAAPAPASGACALNAAGPTGWGDILAVTFTNAAAAEMRERVITQLKSAALGRPLQGLPLDAQAAGRWVTAIMRDMSALQIRTIDSLLHLIVRAAALDLGLHPDFQPVFASEEALTPYLDLLLDEARRRNPAMLELLRQVCHALVRHGNSRGFLAGEKILSQLRPFMDKALLGELEGVSPPAELEQRRTTLIKAARAAARNLLDAAAALAWKKQALNAVEDLAAGTVKDSAFLKKADAAELFLKNQTVPPAVAAAFARCAACARDCLEEFPLLQLGQRYAPTVELARTLAEAFRRNQAEEGRLPGLLIPHLAADLLRAEHGVPDALCRLGARLTHFLVDEFQDTSAAQWRALRPLVLEALARGGSLTWVGDVKQSIYGWRGGDPDLFDAVLSDADLTALAPEGERVTLPHNWRSREQVVRHNNRLFAPLENRETALRALTALMPANAPADGLPEAAAKLAQAFAGATQQCPPQGQPGGLVQVEVLEAENVDALNAATLERLGELLEKEIGPTRPWSDVLVLVRSNRLAAETADSLLGRGIPVITENSLRLAGHPLVAQTAALLTFLDNPEDNIAFLAVISGSLFREHPKAAPLAGEDLHAWCAEGPCATPLYRRFRLRWPTVWQALLEPFFNQSGLMTPYDLTLEWFSRLKAASRFPDAAAFLRRFMEVLHRAEEKGLSTLPTFLEHWRDKGDAERVPMPEQMDAVRIMTIHKSKGLEAPVVVVPWTDFRLRVHADPLVVARGGLHYAVGNARVLGAPYFAELTRQARECLHLLYVAFTRARDALYVFRGAPVGGKKSACDALDVLWTAARLSPPYVLGALPAAAAAAAPDATLPETPRQAGALPAGDDNAPKKGEAQAAQPPAAAQKTAAAAEAASAPATAADAATTDAAPWRPMQWLPRLKIYRNPLAGMAFRPEDRGTLLHACLEHLRPTGNPEADARAALERGLRAYALPVPEDADLRRELTASLAWLAAQPRAASWLERGLAEHSLLDGHGNLLRVDLLAPEAWGSLVIDYKSGQAREEHAAQVRAYLRCLRGAAAQNGSAGTARGLLVYLDLHRFRLVEEAGVSPLAERCEELLPPEEAGS
ncbi:UvrD-helicase domain-containing protein [Desulfovibrio legallii]|uniref:DNA 3'-5' helicase n=1 Tax=Desulfovibrio legallii TaxID=571438 RepID=A0A1G7KFM9_9BACT|nr:UvrD-helicase domain-containing protein [Desulfovibrio legallii]SDF36098.1 ATP-dependent exoDNAse (exonuclease V) beta subunit (contains helicase and exonuclease domains) [Desulfovibrio legallii]